jgi:hypothetical protein
MNVEPSFALWLKSLTRVAEAVSAPIVANWGDRAVTSEIVSPLALKPDAVAEAARQLAFLGAPMVEETVSVPGLLHGLYGRAVQLFADAPGYRTGPVVFVIGVEEAGDVARTTLTVLRRLS